MSGEDNNMNDNKKRINRRLDRPEMTLQLARISRKNPELSYARFCIEAIKDMNPEKNTNPDDNFSRIESIRGWMSPKPLNKRIAMSQDLRLILDSLKRLDLYAAKFCDNIRWRWNHEAGNETKQVRIIKFAQNEIHPATKRNPEQIIPVYHSYIRFLRGKDEVGQLDKHLADEMNGIEETRETIQNCVNTRAVDRAFDEVIEENERIRNRGF
jgi:hypothetical protein